MSKKLLTSLAPLVAVVAFVAMPAVAQAAHWEVNKSSSPVGKTEVFSWGHLALTNTAGGTPVECENATVGWVEKGGAKEETTGWSGSECKDEECEKSGIPGAAIGVVFENELEPGSNPVGLKWKGELAGTSPSIRLVSKGVRTFVRCHVASEESTEKPATGPFAGLNERNSTEIIAPGGVTCSAGAGGGTSSPKTVNAELPLASKLTFTGGAGGELTCSNAGKGITTGTLRTLGFNEQEEITAHN